MSKLLLDEYPEFHPEQKHEPLYTAILLQHGSMDRDWMWNTKIRTQIYKMISDFDVQVAARIVSKRDFDEFLVKFQVWCALNERT